MKITLPDGHDWKEARSDNSNETLFICKDCGASFTHDMIDDSTHFEDGYGSCAEES